MRNCVLCVTQPQIIGWMPVMHLIFDFFFFKNTLFVWGFFPAAAAALFCQSCVRGKTLFSQ